MRHSLLLGCVCACTLAAQSNNGAGSIEGHVLNSLNNAPLRKANVVLTANRSAPQRYIRLVADTDAAGKFEFTGLPPGTYRLSASRAGFLERPARRVVSLGPDDHATGAEIRLPPQGVISGRILDEDDYPEPMASVSVFKQVYRYGRKQWERLNVGIRANEAGEYRVPNLVPGRYFLQAMVQRAQPDNRYSDPDSPAKAAALYYPVYYPSASTQQEASPVDVGPGTEVGGIDIRLFKTVRPPPSVHVRGRITGLPADFTYEIYVGLTSTDGDPFGWGSANAKPPDYTFHLTARPGQYKLTANASSAEPGFYGVTSLAVSGDVSGVVVPMGPVPKIAGRISVAEGGSKVNVQGVRVALNARGMDWEVRSDATGRFIFPQSFQPGQYTMYVRYVPDGCYVRDVKLGGQEISLDNVDLSAPAQLEIVLSSTAATIAGTVSDADGKPYPNSSVTLIPADGKSRPERLSVDDEGKFQFTRVRPGSYKLFAWEEVDDDLWQDPEFRKKYEDRATEIAVSRSETQTAQLRVIPAEQMK